MFQFTRLFSCCKVPGREKDSLRTNFVTGKNKICQLFTPIHQYTYSPYCSLYICLDADKENLFDNQETVELMIICCILITLMCDSVVIL